MPPDGWDNPSCANGVPVNLRGRRPLIGDSLLFASACGWWLVVARPISVRHFEPQRERALLEGDFDALYVLAGTFQPAIATIAQLFHQLQPRSAILRISRREARGRVEDG